VHNSQKIRAILSQAAPASTPEQWTDATLASLQMIVQTTHGNVVPAFESNLELMRELQRQASEMQGLLSTSLKEPAGAQNGVLNHCKRSAPRLVA
jgi:hypothetical protein